MNYKAVEVIWIFSADGRAGGRTDGRTDIEGSIRGPRGPKNVSNFVPLSNFFHILPLFSHGGKDGTWSAG